jgi:hypothetical protein
LRGGPRGEHVDARRRGEVRPPQGRRPKEGWDVESATGKGVLYVGHSKNETSKRKVPLNGAARDAITRMLKRADELSHTDAEHYLWCASQHHHYDPTKPAKKWDGA